MARKTKNSRGFSLIEILIGIAILGVLLTAIYSLFMSANKSQISQDLEVEMQQNARSALDFMVRELKGMSAIICLENTTTTCPGTTGDKIVFTSVTDPTDTRIFSWSSTDNILRFSKAPSGSEDRQPLADNITAISLTSFDANNNSTTALGSVRRIDITLTARTSRIDPNTKGYRTFSTTTSVTKRN
jgi:prepilin-type N-terminal cleavage/methylation domain-containing protein